MALEPLAGTRTKDPHGTGAPGLTGHPFPQVMTRDSDFFLPLAGSEGYGSRKPCVLPDAGGHGRCQLPALLLAPRLCWHQPESEAALIGSCVCGQGVMKRFSVSLCKFP